jgi:hypothetical protein
MVKRRINNPTGMALFGAPVFAANGTEPNTIRRPLVT